MPHAQTQTHVWPGLVPLYHSIETTDLPSASRKECVDAPISISDHGKSNPDPPSKHGSQIPPLDYDRTESSTVEASAEPRTLKDNLRESDIVSPSSYPPGNTVSQESVRSYREHPFSIDRVEQLEQEQDGLRDARDELLGARYRLQLKRNEFRNVRQHAGEKQGSVLSLLRKQYHLNVTKGSEEIQRGLSELEAVQDTLGKIEDDYDKAEEDYNRLEWHYTQKETDFIDGLVNDSSRTHALPIYQERVAEVENIARFALGTPESLQYHADTVDLDAAIATPYLIEKDDGVEKISMSPEKDPPTPQSTSAFSNPPRATTMIHLSSTAQDTDEFLQLPRPYSENDLSPIQLAWEETRKRINSWIFDSLSISPFQRALLKGYLDQVDMDDSSWWHLVMEHWSSDNSTSRAPELKIRRSSTSHEIMPSPTRSSALHSVNEQKLGYGLNSITPLLPEDHVLDALDAPMNPATIEPSDLLESAPRRFHIVDHANERAKTTLHESDSTSLKIVEEDDESSNGPSTPRESPQSDGVRIDSMEPSNRESTAEMAEVTQMDG
ncbi:hypothetical protein BDV95DRAFT_160720 [Massariosphaeria phaeospora]|uniref:Uncharacterized protein n=1 Tax=Massariosphaeria phaeospora TaxID=100035 RepID=A0A7C8IA73_9PLEO|nr:hypothetical protein BDV95DRAFT_160720 [Massariosphaeria phaeospora]